MAVITNLKSIVQTTINNSFTDVEIKTKYENNADTNVLTDALKTMINNVGSIVLDTNDLKYTDEAGTVTTISLAKYLDDTTNTVSSGTLDGSTGIATFTRADNSTFTLDLNALLDNQTASEVPVVDTNGHYNATDVEGILAEIATNSENDTW